MGAVVMFEGVDKAGKTTLIDALRELEPWKLWPVLKLNFSRYVLNTPTGAYIEDVSEAYHKSIVTFKKYAPLIMDRGYVTSYVYSQLFFRQYDLSYLKTVAREINPVVIYVRTDFGEVVRRLQAEGDKMITDTVRLMSLYSLYDRWYEDNPFGDRVVKIDPLQHSDPAAAVKWLANAITTSLAADGR